MAVIAGRIGKRRIAIKPSDGLESRLELYIKLARAKEEDFDEFAAAAGRGG
jgi:hypothetical protein